MQETLISLRGVTLDYPVYSMHARSLRRTAANLALGGSLLRGPQQQVIVRALDNISFDLTAGDRLALVGPNGSGKSSMLKVLAGIYEPTNGRLAIHGRVASMLDIGQGLDMEATGVQNVRLLACMRGQSPWKIRNEIDEIIDFSELGAFANMPVRTYSSGMLTRLLFAVATAFDYEILLLEEWLSAGDHNFVDKATARMGKLVEKARVIITATHSMELMSNLCNKALFLDHGRAAYFGEPSGYLARLARGG